MNKEFRNIIVKKSDDIEIGQFNDSEDFIVTQKNLGNRVVINSKTLNILNLIDGNTSLEDIVVKYNSQYDTSGLEINTLYALLYENLSKYGIIVDDSIVLKKRGVASYLSLSFTLVSQKNIAFFTRVLSPVFKLNHFYKILFFSLGIVFFTVYYNYTRLINYVDSISFNDWIIYVLIGGAILFLHEFGHATACKKLGAEPGAIGFGFYLLSPVMFADVSDIWKLKRKERIIVNFAGLYVEILTALILVIVYYFTHQISLLVVCTIVLFSFVFNLNPFLRYDGYWILSDLINVPNLRKVSMQKLNSLFQHIKGKSNYEFTFKNIFLIIYAFLSAVLIFMFLAFIIIKDPNSLLLFPANIYSYIKSIIIKEKNLALTDLSQFVLPILFYFILIKFSIGYVFKRIKSSKNSIT